GMAFLSGAFPQPRCMVIVRLLMSGVHVPAPDNPRRLGMGRRNNALATGRESMNTAKRLVPLLAAFGLAGGGALAAPPAYAAAPLLVSKLNGKCADIFMFHQGNGASTVTWDCTGNTNQQWRWDGEQIRSGLNGKCLEIYAFNQGDQGSVSMWDCDGGSN